MRKNEEKRECVYMYRRGERDREVRSKTQILGVSGCFSVRRKVSAQPGRRSSSCVFGAVRLEERRGVL